MPARIRRIVENTLRCVVRTAIEAGSSHSCTAKDGSTRWIIPRVAVLTGVDATTSTWGWNEEDVLLVTVDTSRWRSDHILVFVYFVHW